MRNYREMTPCERIAYYRDKIHGFSRPYNSREQLLIETFRQLITENEILCTQQSSPHSSNIR
jgi:hypothetical protein